MHACRSTLEDPTSKLEVDRPLAIVFGSEKQGLSAYTQENADGYFQVPMYGFVESFNISVCAALCVHDLTRRLRETESGWRLSEGERRELWIQWAVRTIPNGDKIVRRWAEERGVPVPGFAEELLPEEGDPGDHG